MLRPRDTAENREQWPEVFIWSCCDEDGAAGGWRAGRHMESEADADELKSAHLLGEALSHSFHCFPWLIKKESTNYKRKASI